MLPRVPGKSTLAHSRDMDAVSVGKKDIHVLGLSLGSAEGTIAAGPSQLPPPSPTRGSCPRLQGVTWSLSDSFLPPGHLIQTPRALTWLPTSSLECIPLCVSAWGQSVLHKHKTHLRVVTFRDCVHRGFTCKCPCTSVCRDWCGQDTSPKHRACRTLTP